jgi:hypothetical protein
VPGLVNQGTLVLDLATIANITLGSITTWNHEDIRALNPTLANLLPNASITVVIPTDGSAPVVRDMFAKSMCAASSLFASAVRPQPLIARPSAIPVASIQVASNTLSHSCRVRVCVPQGGL